MIKACCKSVIVVGFLSSCTTTWVNTRADGLPLDGAKMHCEGLAHQRFPVKNEVAQRTRPAVRKNNFFNFSCHNKNCAYNSDGAQDYFLERARRRDFGSFGERDSDHKKDRDPDHDGHNHYHLEVWPQKTESDVMDVNASSREAVFDHCMADQGWITKLRWGI